MANRAGVAIVVLCALIGGCGSLFGARGERYTSIDYFPLHPGTLWVYEVRDALGGVALERVLVRGPIHLRTHDTEGVIVEESGGVGGELALDVEWHPLVYYRRDRFLYKFSGVDYVEGRLREQAIGEGEEKILPDDPTEHREWRSDFDVFRADAGADRYHAAMRSVASRTSRAVRVRAGVFTDCLHVESESHLASPAEGSRDATLGFRYLDWYAAGVGLVRSEVWSLDTDRLLTTLELVSFRDGRVP